MVMRLFLSIVLLLAGGLEIHAQEEMARRAKPWVSPCETLCANLTQAIKERPDLMVMRLEDALVINEACAAEIVTAAIDAVRGNSTKVQQIMETAVKVAPSRSGIVMQAVHSYIPLSRRAVVTEVEVRRAEIPENAPLFEIRRAEVATSVVSQPIEEVRRAEVPALRAIESNPTGRGPQLEPTPIEEIRRAEVTEMKPTALSASR